MGAVTLSVSLNAIDAGYVSVFPADQTTTSVSNVNAAAGERLYGVATSAVDDGDINITSGGNSVVGVAVTGYYISRLPDPAVAGAIDESGPVVYEYDRTQRLTVTRGADNAETRYEYWDTNARVAQHHPDGTITYYLGSVQATHNPTSGEWVTARRAYTHGGATVASRQVTPAPVPGVGTVDEVSVLLGNHQGSITTTITNNQAATRYYTP